MSKNNLKKGVVLVMSFMMLLGTITVMANGRKDATATVSGNTKVIGSVYLEDSGFWQHRGNWTAGITGTDRDAVTIRFYLYDKNINTDGSNKFLKYDLGSTGLYFKAYSKAGWFSTASTAIGSTSDYDKYLVVQVSD